MPQPTSADRRAAAQAGFFGRVAGFSGALAAYFSARLRLLGLEGKEAAVHFAVIAGLVAAAIMVVVFGYFFLCMGIIFTIAWLIGGQNTWIWLTFAMALVHFGGAVFCLFMAKSRFSKPMFTTTLDEFKKDQQWLNDPMTARVR